MMLRPTFAVAAIGCLLIACDQEDATSPDGGTPQAADVGAWDPFFVLIAFTRVTPIPLTPREQVDQSSAIVEGYFDDVRDGRVGDFKEGASNPQFTAVFRIRVEHVAKGEPVEYVYVEFHRGGIPVDRMLEILPRETPMTFLLRLASETWEPKQTVFTNDGAGLPEGETLYSFLYPAGVAVEGAAGIDYPLADDPFEPIFNSSNLAELRNELVSLMPSPTD